MVNLSELYRYYQTDDATALAQHIQSGETAYVNGGKVMGTLEVPPSDPNFASVGFLLPDTGRELSFSIYDTNTRFVADTPKFGSTSLAVDGAGDLLRSSIPTALGTLDFTIETWLWPVNGGAGNNYGRIIQMGPNGTNGGLYIVRLGAPNPLQFLVQTHSGSYWTVMQGGTSLPNTTWSHIALVREAGDWSFYINGVRTLQNTGVIPGDNLTQTTFYLGANNSQGEGFNGRFNNTRITRGVARYSGATYTVPTEGFPRN